MARHQAGTSNFVVILFHGLGGSVDSTYIDRTTLIAQRLGHGVLAVNHRGCGEGRDLARRPYHSGRGDDVSAVIEFARTHFSGKSLIAVGFSLGANAVLNLVCKLRGETEPDFAVAVNGPTDLAAASSALTRGLNRLYDLSFVLGCRKEIQSKMDKGWLKQTQMIPRLANLYDVDRLYTAPEGGFTSAEDYYERCSTFEHFNKVTTPTVILSSKDDPFIAWKPYLNAQSNSNIHLHLEECGGHMGYLGQGKSRLSYRRWLDEALEEILIQIVK